MSKKDQPAKPDGLAWAEFRFSVVGHLLACPPKTKGELKGHLAQLSAKTYRHPLTGGALNVSWHTLERWYYRARKGNDPISSLRKKTRRDRGTCQIREAAATALLRQHQDYPNWSYRLHTDNLAALIESKPELGKAPSYMTVCRFLKGSGCFKQQKSPQMTAGQALAAHRLDTREVRSFEVSDTGALWHLDFHHGSLPVLTEDGRWVKPIALAITDDFSRLACHVQWYLTETTKDLVHGFAQALQKRGLPRALMTDNGAAMTSDEFTGGLSALGIMHDTSLPYSPYQNGKVEKFWALLEGRFMAMIEGQKSLNLKTLNDMTQAWVEMEYNRLFHSEINSTPLERYLGKNDVSRAPPSSDDLKSAFRLRVHRRRRRTDSTVSIEGVRFEIPSHYRSLDLVTLAYARWDMAFVHLLCEQTQVELCRIYPLDKEKNSDALRRSLAAPASLAPSSTTAPTKELPALMLKLVADFAATGYPMPYIPQDYEDRP